MYSSESDKDVLKYSWEFLKGLLGTLDIHKAAEIQREGVRND